MRYTTLFIDLDDTVYDSSNGLWEAIRKRMSEYIQTHLQMPPDEVAALRRRYFETYGTTLRGLQIHHEVDTDEYLSYVHDLPLREYLQPDPDLKILLESIPQKKYIFTNADAAHAVRAMEIIGIRSCFTGIIDVRAMGFYCKPEPEAYLMALQIAEESDPSCCIFIDDSPRNVASAYRLGFMTVLTGSENGPAPLSHVSIKNLKSLPQAVPEIWL